MLALVTALERNELSRQETPPDRSLDDAGGADDALIYYLNDRFGKLTGAEAREVSKALVRQVLNPRCLAALFANSDGPWPPLNAVPLIASVADEHARLKALDEAVAAATDNLIALLLKYNKEGTGDDYPLAWAAFFSDFYVSRPGDMTLPVSPLAQAFLLLHSANTKWARLRDDGTTFFDKEGLSDSASRAVFKKTDAFQDLFERARAPFLADPSGRLTDRMRDRLADARALADNPTGPVTAAAARLLQGHLPHVTGYVRLPLEGADADALVELCKGVAAAGIDPVDFLAQRFPRTRFVDLFGATANVPGALVLPPVPLDATKTTMAERLLGACRSMTEDGDRRVALYMALAVFLLNGSAFPAVAQSPLSDRAAEKQVLQLFTSAADDADDRPSLEDMRHLLSALVFKLDVARRVAADQAEDKLPPRLPPWLKWQQKRGNRDAFVFLMR